MSHIQRTDAQQRTLESGPFSVAVATEMVLQDRAWGASPERDLTWAEWMLVFQEEVSEVQADAKSLYWTNANNLARLRNLRSELIQVAALCGQLVKVVDVKLAALSDDPMAREGPR